MSDTVQRRRLAALAALGLAAFALLGCESLPQGDADAEILDSEERRRARTVQGSLLDSFGVNEVAGVNVGSERQAALTGTEVNRHLWRASLDTLNFLPIASTDPFTGLIATDWASPEGQPDERFRVQAYVGSTTLAAESLDVRVFREVRAPQGWAAAPTTPGVERQIEDAILVRARQLRLAERETG